MKVFAMLEQQKLEHVEIADSKAEHAKAIFNGALGVHVLKDVHQAQHNAQTTDTKYALHYACGKTPALMLMEMQKTCNAVTAYAIMQQEFMMLLG